MLLFHRTSVSRARTILRDGFENDKWNFGSDELTGEPVNAVGVWLTDRPPSEGDGPPGAAVLEVTLTLPEEALAPFAVHRVLAETQLWILPARIVNEHAGIRLSGVDARSSWFHERIEEADQ